MGIKTSALCEKDVRPRLDRLTGPEAIAMEGET